MRPRCTDDATETIAASLNTLLPVTGNICRAPAGWPYGSSVR